MFLVRREEVETITRSFACLEKTADVAIALAALNAKPMSGL